MKATLCDACGQIIWTKPAEVPLHKDICGGPLDLCDRCHFQVSRAVNNLVQQIRKCLLP